MRVCVDLVCQSLKTSLPEPDSMFEVMDFMQNSFVRGNSVSEAGTDLSAAIASVCATFSPVWDLGI